MLKHLMSLLLVFLIVACDDGSSDGTLSLDSSSYSSTTVDDTTDDTTTISTSYTISAGIYYLENAPDGDLLGNNSVTDDAPAAVVVYLTDSDGEPMAQEVVTFTTTLGELDPSSGTALTDDDGMAFITVKAGDTRGASEITAIYDDISATTAFFTEGDDVDEDTDAEYALTLYDCSEATDWNSDDLDTISNCSETNLVEPDRPGYLLITVTSDGATLSDELVKVESDLAAIYPTLGTAITDDEGRAMVNVVADDTVGAGSLTVSGVTVSGEATLTFSVGSEDLSLVVVTVPADTTSIDAGSTLVIQAQIYDDDDELYESAVTVEFSSSCTENGDSTMDESVTSVGGLASSVYLANGCEGDDLISVTVDTGDEALSQTLNLTVEEADVGSIAFVSAEPESLALRGTGSAFDSVSSETSTVTFQVFDEQGSVKSLADIEFELSSTMGDTSVTSGSVTSNADGYVYATVTSGYVPQTVRVVAKLVDDDDSDAADTQVSGISSDLVISSGLPDEDSFSISADILNPRAFNYDGTEVNVTVRASDHNNNPVADDTAIYFQAEGGSIESSCMTVDGTCSVTWTSSDPRPADGRVTVLATANGEESFTDLNGNGLFDSTDTLDTDLPEAWQDDDEDGSYDSGSEAFRDLDDDEEWDDADGLYNGLLCSDEGQTAGACLWTLEDSDVLSGLIEVREDIVLVMSGDAAYVTTDPTSTLDISSGSGSLMVYVADVNGNPMPYGTTISFDTSNGELVGTTSYEIGSTNASVGSTVYAYLKKDDDSDTGILTITVSVPDVVDQVTTVTVTD